MANTKVHFSSASNEWATPMLLYVKLNRYFHFTLDPCCTYKTSKCPTFFTKEDDGLAQDWIGVNGKASTVFMNPPYAREIPKWIKKAYYESAKGNTVVCLIPARTDTAWWHDYCLKGEILFLRGRVKFEQDGKPLPASAPFPSCLVVFSPNGAIRAANSNLLRLFGEEYNKRVDKRNKSCKVIA